MCEGRKNSFPRGVASLSVVNDTTELLLLVPYAQGRECTFDAILCIATVFIANLFVVEAYGQWNARCTVRRRCYIAFYVAYYNGFISSRLCITSVGSGYSPELLGFRFIVGHTCSAFFVGEGQGTCIGSCVLQDNWFIGLLHTLSTLTTEARHVSLDHASSVRLCTVVTCINYLGFIVGGEVAGCYRQRFYPKSLDVSSMHLCVDREKVIV